MTKLRTKLNVKTKLKSGNFLDFSIEKDCSIIAAITALIKYIPMDYEEAKKQINSTLDKEINRVK